MSGQQKIILIKDSPEIEGLLKANNISFEVVNFLFLPEVEEEDFIGEFDYFSLGIPKILIPILKTIGKLTGKDLISFLNDLLYKDLETIWEEPYNLFEYHLDREKSKFFIDFERGLEIWKEKLNEEYKRDHKQKEKPYIQA